MMTIARKIGLGVVIALAILVTIGAVALWCTSRLIAASRWITHTHEVLENLEALVSTIKGAEASQCEYLLTGKGPYLDSFKASFGEADRILAHLKALTIDNPDEQERLGALQAAVEAGRGNMETTIAARREEGAGGMPSVVAPVRGRR